MHQLPPTKSSILEPKHCFIYNATKCLKRALPRFCRQTIGHSGVIQAYLAKWTTLNQLHTLEIALARVQFFFDENGPLQIFLDLLLQLQTQVLS